MSETEQEKTKQGSEKEPFEGESMFPDREGFEVFIERVKRLAPGCGVSPENTKRLVKLLEEKYGKDQYGRELPSIYHKRAAG